MKQITELLKFAKAKVSEVGNDFLAEKSDLQKIISNTQLNGRETKLVADERLDRMLASKFLSTHIPILSEESGISLVESASPFRWIIDPLDGSVNYLSGLGPSAISVALWRYGQPIFGVLFRLDDHSLAWGGRNIGAWINDRAIRVSEKLREDQAILCSGLPARFSTKNSNGANQYFHRMMNFAKVRMIGSAACSLLFVARGQADLYFEDNIMLWDVAAGIAIVEGAGGSFSMQPGSFELSFNVTAGGALMRTSTAQTVSL